MIRLGRVGERDRVLDLGCATGGFTDSIAEASGSYLAGCDMSTAMLDHVHKPLALADAEKLCNRELADRYPFVGAEERDEGFTRMREHWAARRGTCVDARESTFLIASKI